MVCVPGGTPSRESDVAAPRHPRILAAAAVEDGEGARAGGADRHGGEGTDDGERTLGVQSKLGGLARRQAGTTREQAKAQEKALSLHRHPPLTGVAAMFARRLIARFAGSDRRARAATLWRSGGAHQ